MFPRRILANHVKKRRTCNECEEVNIQFLRLLANCIHLGPSSTVAKQVSMVGKN